MKQSISQGITGTNDDTLLHTSHSTNDTNSMRILDPMGNNNYQGNNPPPIQWGRLITQLFNGNARPKQINPIVQLHSHIRKEDWSLATELVNAHPELARTWHTIERLYGGKYDGEALPLHAACALHPPPSFVRLLAECYPEGLLEKDKAFGRVPLAVACRSLAESSVVRTLCELEPRAVEERDNLKRVPLHYLIKNYSTFGEDDEDSDANNYEYSTWDDDSKCESNEDDSHIGKGCNATKDKSIDGMVSLKILVKSNPNCVRVADHRGWIPLHVALSCSSRKGMTRVVKYLLRVWPESINVKTDKESDVFQCVDMVGIHHPTKEKVISILKFAQAKLSDGEEAEVGKSSDSSCSLDKGTEDEEEDAVSEGENNEDTGSHEETTLLDLSDFYSPAEETTHSTGAEEPLLDLIHFDNNEELNDNVNVLNGGGIDEGGSSQTEDQSHSFLIDLVQSSEGNNNENNGPASSESIPPSGSEKNQADEGLINLEQFSQSGSNDNLLDGLQGGLLVSPTNSPGELTQNATSNTTQVAENVEEPPMEEDSARQPTLISV